MIHTAVKKPNGKNNAADLVSYVEEEKVEDTNVETNVEETTTEKAE